MQTFRITSAILLAAFGTQVWAADIGSKNSFPAGSNMADGNQVGKGHEGAHEWRHHHEPVSLEEARKRAHEHAERLDKMTPAEWDAEQKRHHEHMEKWRQEHHGERGGDVPPPPPPHQE